MTSFLKENINLLLWWGCNRNLKYCNYQRSIFYKNLPLGKLKFCKLEFYFTLGELNFFLMMKSFQRSFSDFFFLQKPKNLEIGVFSG